MTRDSRLVARDCSRRNPFASHWWQAFPYIETLWSTRVVHSQRRLAPGERDLPHRHPDPLRSVDVDLLGVGKCLAVVAGRSGGLSVGRSCGLTDRSSRFGGGCHRAHSESSREGALRPGRLAGAALPSPVSAGSGSKGDISIGVSRQSPVRSRQLYSAIMREHLCGLGSDGW